ncbi:MAG TPA: hypothetical protein VID77_01535 [Stellaceae bacterium]|jgi:hypothetical protein
MGRTDDAPQTVAEALRHGWNYLGVACDHCRSRRTRVDLAKQPKHRRLAEIAFKCWCRKCGPVLGRNYLSFELVAVRIDERTKPIHFSGLVAFKIGMH